MPLPAIYLIGLAICLTGFAINEPLDFKRNLLCAVLWPAIVLVTVSKLHEFLFIKNKKRIDFEALTRIYLRTERGRFMAEQAIEDLSYISKKYPHLLSDLTVLEIRQRLKQYHADKQKEDTVRNDRLQKKVAPKDL